MILAVTNVILDVLQDDPHWAAWSMDRLSEARVEGDVIVNAVIVAELSRDYDDVDGLRAAIASLGIRVEAIDDRAAFLAGKRFAEARKDRQIGSPARPLPDFFIGAHAASSGARLLTRDPAIYRRYFPDLTLITPGTHPDG